jgi:hypothetical protein
MPLHSSHAGNQASQSARSNNEVPIDPSIAASPTYPPQSQYPTYQTQPDMYGAGHPGVYGRPEWASGHYQQPPPMTHYGHPTSSGPPSAGLVSPVNRPPAVPPVFGKDAVQLTFARVASLLFILLFLFPVLSNINVLEDDMKKLSVCTNVVGKAVKRPTEL